MNEKDSLFKMFLNGDVFPESVEVAMMQMDSLDFGYLEQKCLEGALYRAYGCWNIFVGKPRSAMPAAICHLTCG